MKLKKESFNVFKVLDELESYFKLNNSKDIKIRFLKRRGDKELTIYNDPTRFRQVFTNLLNNACKYTEKGKIEFGYTRKKEHLEFFVSDTGIGIDESEYQNIFNFFHKIDKGDNQFYRGAGIGLSISNKLVELMGGRIWLKSEVGKGTTFFFSFPDSRGRSIKEKAQLSGLQDVKSGISLDKMVIVIAEDDPANYSLIEKILRRTHARLIWARNGQEAVGVVKDLENKEHCIVIMDIKMPVMNGIRAAEQIRKIHKDIPVIAVTAYAQTQNREDLLRQNFVDYIAKPLEPGILINAIQKHVKKTS